MAKYDPKVIYTFATSLYSRAQMIVFIYTFFGILAGGILGNIYKSATSSSSLWMLLGAVVLGLLGFWIGSNKAFVLKLQAQTALCQVKIEENTNPVVART